MTKVEKEICGKLVDEAIMEAERELEEDRLSPIADLHYDEIEIEPSEEQVKMKNFE